MSESAHLGATLLALARAAIEERLGLPARTVDTTAPQLNAPGASFVTLTRAGQLRGCIGSLEAHRRLIDDVRENARTAAFRDPRFAPVTAAEWPQLQVEVSLLTPARPLSFTDEADALRQLRPGIDGVILGAGSRRATFLPQVWEQLPSTAEFIAHLKQKAGLPADWWGPEARLAVYTVDKWKEAKTADQP